MAGGFEGLGLSEELIRAVEGDLNWLLPTVRDLLTGGGAPACLPAGMLACLPASACLISFI
jgi:hypothetical protein